MTSDCFSVKSLHMLTMEIQTILSTYSPPLDLALVSNVFGEPEPQILRVSEPDVHANIHKHRDRCAVTQLHQSVHFFHSVEAFISMISLSCFTLSSICLF